MFALVSRRARSRNRNSAPLSLVYLGALLAAACQDAAHAPPSRPEPAAEPDPSALTPIDLVYICGNKFLVTNATRSAVRVTYRVAETQEVGSLTLHPGPVEDPAYSETELETKGRGAVELYQDDELVVRRRNEGSSCGPPSMSGIVAAGPENVSGSWSAPFPWVVVGLHLHLLPNGRVLSWGHGGTPQVWDPATGEFTATPSPAWLFCAGHAFLPDGRLLVAGGHIANGQGLPAISIFDTEGESWISSTPMQRGRWYPSATTLGNGDVVILSGRDQNEVLVNEPEVWSPGGIRRLSNALRTLKNYPRAFLAPNGNIFVAGQDSVTLYLDPSGAGSWNRVAARLYGVRDYGAAVMYEPGRILYAGGGRTTNTAEIINLNAAVPAWQWTGSMAFARRHVNAILLPTGEVLVTGGTAGPEHNDLSTAVLAAEIWNPATGLWTTVASNAVARGYHSTSILLPDGRVLHAGSGDNSSGINQLNAELYSPPYLFKGARPTIAASPSEVGYGTSFVIQTPDAADIAKVSLIRLGSTTHAFDQNQRFQWLQFNRGAGELTITVSADRNRTPPGHYMLFILNGGGVPSVGKIVRVGDAPQPFPVNSPPDAAFTESCIGLGCAFTDRSSDTDGDVSAWSWEFGDGGTSTLQNPSHTYGAAGDYSVTLTVSDDDGAPDAVTRTVTVAAAPANSAPTAAFTQSCTGLICLFTDQSTDTDGALTSWSWNFGDGGTSTLRNPSRTYGSGGTYTVTLRATDDDGATGEHSAPVTVSPPAGIVLSATTRTDATKYYFDLVWSGANGTRVEIYRNGKLIRTTVNDGQDTNSKNATGATSYRLRVCEIGAARCSSEVTVRVSPPPPAAIVLNATGRRTATRHIMDLTWSGASGTTVDIYRNGSFLRNTPNDGRDSNGRNATGAARYVFRLCERGSTTRCSNEATVTFN